jgi:hypothetical protein
VHHFDRGLTAVIGALGASTDGTFLPTEDTTGTQPNEHVDGVGALPGSNSESGVAQLPLERHAENSVTSRTVEGDDDSTISKAKDAVSQIKTGKRSSASDYLFQLCVSGFQHIPRRVLG